jgi:hypothetical protein
MTTDLDTTITAGLTRLAEHVRMEHADEFRQRLSEAADVGGSSSARSVRPSSAGVSRPGRGATAIAPRPRRARVVLAAGIAGVLVIAGIVAIVAGNGDSDTPTLQPADTDSLPSSETPTTSAEPAVSTDPSQATTPATAEVPGEVPGEASVVPPVTGPPTVDGSLTSATTAGTGTAVGIDVTIETPGQVLAGTRTPIDVTVVNNSAATIYWQAGGCAIPVEVSVSPLGTPVVAPAPSQPGSGWDGNLHTLLAWVEDPAHALTTRLAQSESTTGWSTAACPSVSKMSGFAPGETLSYKSTVEMRIPPGPLPADGQYEVKALFTGYATPDGYQNRQPLDTIDARLGFTVIDHPTRARSDVEETVIQILGDGRLAAWLPTTVIPGRPDLVQTYTATLEWWRDAWELRVQAYFESQDILRLRLNLSINTVVDARVIHYGGPPGDEPDTVAIPGSPPDDILPLPAASASPEGVVEPPVVSVGATITVTAPAQTDTICGNIAMFYKVTAEGTREAGALLGSGPDEPTWNTPPEGSPITIPPCGEAPNSGPVTYTVPDLDPGTYQICLTREADACATFEVIAS